MANRSAGAIRPSCVHALSLTTALCVSTHRSTDDPPASLPLASADPSAPRGAEPTTSTPHGPHFPSPSHRCSLTSSESLSSLPPPLLPVSHHSHSAPLFLLSISASAMSAPPPLRFSGPSSPSSSSSCATPLHPWRVPPSPPCSNHPPPHPRPLPLSLPVPSPQTSTSTGSAAATPPRRTTSSAVRAPS